jgi:DNA polymerase V
MAGKPYDGGGTTGFVNSAGDSLEGPIDFSDFLALRRPNRYPVRALGEALRERGIFPDDVLITDAAAPPASGRVCVALVHGDMLLATLVRRGSSSWLKPSSEHCQPVEIEGEAAEIWGIVCGLVRRQR